MFHLPHFKSLDCECFWSIDIFPKRPFSFGSPQDHISPVSSLPGLDLASWPFSITVSSQEATGLSILTTISASREKIHVFLFAKKQEAIFTIRSWWIAAKQNTGFPAMLRSKTLKPLCSNHEGLLANDDSTNSLVYFWTRLGAISFLLHSPLQVISGYAANPHWCEAIL